MSDQENTEVTEEATPKEEAKGLRKQLNEAHAEIKKLRQRDLDDGLAAIGPASDQGLGKAIAKEYDGEYTNDSIAAFAQNEYGYVGPTGSQHEAAGQIQAGQAALDQAGQGAGSVPIAPSKQQQQEDAEARKDYQTSLGMKANTMAEWFGGKP